MSSSDSPIKSLTGKVALVTGAGRGIGHGIALELGKRGASVIVNYANSKEGSGKLVKEIESFGSKAIAIQADVSKTPEVKRLFKESIDHFGRLDVVCSNAGKEVFCPEQEVTEKLYDEVFALNARAQFFVAQQAFIHLSEGGRIILMSSVAATMSGVPNHALYAGSKAAVEGFTRSFSKDCGPRKITVNAIAPGGVKSDMFQQNAWHYSPGGTPGMDIQKIEDGLASLCPLGRVAVPQDIGRVVAFLAHPDSEWINGQVILLSGGSNT